MQAVSLDVLEAFPRVVGLPESDEEMGATMRSPDIMRIQCYALGPEGTNISQAAARWAERMGVSGKTEISLCETPETSLEQAQAVDEAGVIGLFGTCAVYFALNKLFFQNPATLPFFATEIMFLDEMQLAALPSRATSMNGSVPSAWRVASHPSPAPLVRSLECKVVLVNSNAQAADQCAQGIVELCITTESARKSRGLTKLHSFGSPPMVFFYGTAGPSIDVVRNAYANLKAVASSWRQEGSLV
ncbi:hypothetical protein BK004_04560 [bacterium CG10_46_32]|nr:MAG: hypothetical protein BK004_04560 [bacterium CG10_46_32]PIR55714.1 MAG: hypothetical protein COU73_04600 [Parcubacteria group bacterium CG10_big_fil_rev_8_21_14_0_10_46_32]